MSILGICLSIFSGSAAIVEQNQLIKESTFGWSTCCKEPGSTICLGVVSIQAINHVIKPKKARRSQKDGKRRNRQVKFFIIIKYFG